MQQATEPVLRVRVEQLRRHASRLGLLTDSALANHLGISQATIWRMLNGTIKPGERIIARALAAFPDLKFEDLFEVVLEDAPGDAA